jgi:hypothetical protein
MIMIGLTYNASVVIAMTDDSLSLRAEDIRSEAENIRSEAIPAFESARGWNGIASSVAPFDYAQGK